MAPTVLLFVLAFFAQADPAKPLKVTLCDIAAHPETFDGKLVQVRAMVVSGIDDLPAGVTDDACGAELKFLMPDDEHFATLLRNREFRKLTKEVQKHPLVEVTVTGWMKRTATDPKPVNGLIVDSVAEISVKRVR